MVTLEFCDVPLNVAEIVATVGLLTPLVETVNTPDV
jgi:hypothetical protein